MLIVAGKFADVLQGLFQHGEDGYLHFGSARSREPSASSEAVTSWCMFEDCIMEGHVRYALRASPHGRGLKLEVQLTGSNRDRFVRDFVRNYVEWAGFQPIDAEL